MFDIVHQCGATLSLSPDSFDDGKSHGNPTRRADEVIELGTSETSTDVRYTVFRGQSGHKPAIA